MAGRDSQGYAPSRKRCGQRSMSPTRAGTVSPLRDEPTRACMRPDRSRASPSRAAPRSHGPRKLSAPRFPRTSSVLDAEEAPDRLPRALLGAVALVPLPRCASTVAAPRWTRGARSGGHGRSTSRRSLRPRRFSPASTTSARSRRPRRGTTSSCGTSCGRVGAGRRPARLHNHRGRLSAPHGEDARRDDARSRLGSAPTRSGAPRRAAALRRRSEGAAMGPLSRAVEY